MTHGSGQPSQCPYACKVLDRKRVRTHEQMADGLRGVDGYPCNSDVDDTTGCNHLRGARVGGWGHPIARYRGVLMQIPHTEHAQTRFMAEGPPILMHTSVTHPPYKLLIAIESPGRVEVTTSTHDSRTKTALSTPLRVQGPRPKASPYSHTRYNWCTRC